MSVLDRVRSDALGVVGVGPRVVGQALADLRRIAEGMENLPRLLEVLASIDVKVDELNEEVSRMRHGVETIDGRVDRLNDALAEELRQVALAVHPLRRLRAAGRTAKPDPDPS
jgi:hypothetical protein